MSPFPAQSTPLDRARSLARSHVRLVRALGNCAIAPDDLPDGQADLLTQGLELMVQLTDQLLVEPVSGEDARELHQLLEHHDHAFRELQGAVFQTLPAPQVRALRRAMMQVTVSDEDLESLVLAAHRNAADPTGPDLQEATAATPASDDRSAPLPLDLRALFPDLATVGGDLRLTREDQQELSELVSELIGAIDPETMLSDMELSWRQAQEEKRLSLRVGLGPALRAQPAHWVEAIHEHLELPLARRKKERIDAIVDLLSTPVELLEQLNRCDEDERAALQYLLANGGWQKTGPLCKRFGADVDDGWFWLDEPPSSVLGRLRLLGLVYVGRARVGSRRYRVAVIPTSLRATLAEHLDIDLQA